MKRNAVGTPAAASGNLANDWQPNPNNLAAGYTLAVNLYDAGRYHESRSTLKKLLRAKSDIPEALSLMGDIYANFGRDAEAISSYRRALTADPHYAPAEFNLSLALLGSGHWREGWKRFDARLGFLDDSLFPGTPAPAWEGQPLADKSILVWNEPGFGDVIQFARFLHPLLEAGANIFFRCPEELRRLFEFSFPKLNFVPVDGPYPAVDYKCPLLSLPRWIGNGNPKVGSQQGSYLKAPPGVSPAPARTARVGIAWAGNARHRENATRSLPPKFLLPVFKAFPTVEFVTLQPDVIPASDLANRLTDWSQSVRDFADTATLLGNLDVLVTVDTSVAHLAGALGCPVWILLPFPAEWRWGSRRRRTDWYPTARLFRQPRAGDWSSVIEDLRKTMAKFIRPA